MNTPNIRFKGFNEDWEQRKLVEITTKIGSGKTPRGGSEAYVDEGIPLIRSQNVHDDMVDLSDVVFIDEETNKSMENSLVEYNDVLLNITGASIGRSAVYKSSEAANVNQHVCIIRPIEDYSSAFIQMNITSGNGQKQIDSSQAGGAREGLNFQQIGKMAFAFPSIQEQNKLGTYFSNLDTLITLHQRKCDSLKQVKKYMLQKMFPKQGEKVPEIRFAGFTGDWEQRKCGDMTVELSEYCNLQSGYPLLTSSRSGLMFQNDFRDKTSTDNLETLFSVVPYGKCTYRHMSDDNIFHFNINTITEKGLVSREYPVFDASENNNLSFLIQYLNSSPEFTRFCAERKLGGTRTRLYYKNLCEFKLHAPNKNEQDKIAEFFANIDNLITLHQRKLDSLKEIKKFMLQNMFPNK